MNVSAIPVFHPNQVLTADHLNDLREFLDREDRLTRRALIGIGVMCGFELNVTGAGTVQISKGVAVTSAGHLIAEDAVVCDRVRPYEVPIPTGDEVTPEQVEEARYPFLFPDGENQIDAWEMLTTEATVPANEPPPDTLAAPFLNDKTVMLFLECTEESLKNCDINDCSDKGAELQFVLRRLLVRREDADAMMAREANIAELPTDRAKHPGLKLKYLRVEDLGLARNGIWTFPALFARILQIAGRFSAYLPNALRDAWDAYRYLLDDMYPAGQFPNGPFPDGYFGNVWGNLLVQPFLAQYFYDYMLDAAMAYNEFVAKARAFERECLPHPERFPKHVLLGDPLPRPTGFVAAVSSPVEFAGYDPLQASTGFGPQPVPPRRRTSWTPARSGPARDEVRALFHRLTLLAHAFDLGSLASEEIRVTPSRHDDALLGERCIPPYYAFNTQKDLFRVWSPEKTRANLLSTVYSHQFSTRDSNHPYLYRIDGETFYGVAGHIGKDLAQVMSELIVHKRVLELDFHIVPLWIGLGLANDPEGLELDAQAKQRALEALKRLIFCRMGDFEVLLLSLLAALFAFLVYILRGVGSQPMVDHARVPQLAVTTVRAPTDGGVAMNRDLAAEDIARLASMARMDAVRRPGSGTFSALRLAPEERVEINTASADLLARFRETPQPKGTATQVLAGNAGEDSVAAFYQSVKDDSGGNLFDRVRARTTELQLDANQPGATDRIYNAVALMDATETLMAKASTSTLADFDAQGFEHAYANFADRLSDYAATAPADPAGVGHATASVNIAVTDYAPAVAAQTTAFGSAGLLGEMNRRMVAIFADLTLGGFALRHPGLEHRAGVPKGGTLFLAYASKVELAALMEKAAAPLSRLSEAVDFSSPQGGLAAGFAASAQGAAAAPAPLNNDPLSDYIVLADFSLASQCCDNDCSDILLEGALPDGLFDLGGPGSMGVDPVVPNGTAPEAVQPAFGIDDSVLVGELNDIGVGGGTVGTLATGGVSPTPAQPVGGRPVTEQPAPLERSPAPPVAGGDTFVQPDPRSPVRPVAGGETFVQPEIDPVTLADTDRDDFTDDTLGGRPIGRVRGSVTGSGRDSEAAVRNAVVFAINDETGEMTRIETRDGVFQAALPPGRFRLVAQSDGFEGEPFAISVEPSGEIRVSLRLRRRR